LKSVTARRAAKRSHCRRRNRQCRHGAAIPVRVRTDTERADLGPADPLCRPRSANDCASNRRNVCHRQKRTVPLRIVLLPSQRRSVLYSW
jgi:hypothetical protein